MFNSLIGHLIQTKKKVQAVKEGAFYAALTAGAAVLGAIGISKIYSSVYSKDKNENSNEKNKETKIRIEE